MNVQLQFERAVTQDLVVINSDTTDNQFLYLTGYLRSSNNITSITNPVGNITYSNPTLSTVINSQFKDLVIATTANNFNIPGIYSVLAPSFGNIFTYGNVTATLTTSPAPGGVGINFTPGTFTANPVVL